MEELFVKIFLFVCLYCALPILYFMLRNETKAKKNIILGVTLPYLARDREEVTGICAVFRRQLKWAFWILTALAAAGLFFPWLSVFITWEFIWLVAVILVPEVLYIRSHQKLRRLKREMGWLGSYSGKTVVDLSAVKLPKKRVHVIWFILPALISLVPIPFAGENMAMVLPISLSMFALTVLCAALYQAIWRQAADTVDAHTELTAALTRVRRYNWSKSFVVLTWASGLFALPMGFWWDNGLVIMLATAVYTVVVLAACIGAEFAARRAQETLTSGSGTGEYVDEDRYWIWGTFYCNPNDRHLMKNNRVGMGMTVNMARPFGKILVVFSALCIVALPVLGAWMMTEEFTPVHTELEGDTVVAYHQREVYSVPLDTVTEAEILQELPPTARIAGTAMDHVRKGRFRVEGYGECRICLDPGDACFLVLETGEETYIFGAEEALAEQILAAWKSLPE